MRSSSQPSTARHSTADGVPFEQPDWEATSVASLKSTPRSPSAYGASPRAATRFPAPSPKPHLEAVPSRAVRPQIPKRETRLHRIVEPGRNGRAGAMAALRAPLNDRSASRRPPESVAKVAHTSGSRVLILRPVVRTLPDAHDRAHPGPPGVGRVAAGSLLPHTPRGTPTPRACRPSEQKTHRRGTRE